MQQILEMYSIFEQKYRIFLFMKVLSIARKQ